MLNIYGYTIPLFPGANSESLDREQKDASSTNGKIVGGMDGYIQLHPYQSFLSVTEQSYKECGGAIISEYYIVTAAQCISEYTTFYASLLIIIMSS